LPIWPARAIPTQAKASAAAAPQTNPIRTPLPRIDFNPKVSSEWLPTLAQGLGQRTP
jgi:hypothetical protein